MKILVAADEMNIVRQHKVALEARGLHVFLEGNGQDCIDTYNWLFGQLIRGQ